MAAAERKSRGAGNGLANHERESLCESGRLPILQMHVKKVRCTAPDFLFCSPYISLYMSSAMSSKIAVRHLP